MLEIVFLGRYCVLLTMFEWKSLRFNVIEFIPKIRSIIYYAKENKVEYRKFKNKLKDYNSSDGAHRYVLS